MKLLKHIKLDVEYFLNLTHRIRLKGIGFSPFSLNSCSLTDVLVFQKSLEDYFQDININLQTSTLKQF